MTSTRKYHIRFSKKSWHIPIHVVHNCPDEKCSIVLWKGEGNDIYKRNANSPHCPSKGKILRGNYQVSSHESVYDSSILKLDGMDEVVIPDKKIRIAIDFPMLHPQMIPVDFGHHNITRQELLKTISIIYKHIYETEAKTGGYFQCTIEKDCIKCFDTVPYSHVEHSSCKEKNKEKEKECCSICFQEYKEDEKIATLKCKHTFHSACVKPWLEKRENNSCPLCRSSVIKCDDCKGNQVIEEKGEFRNVPYELRQLVPRPQTFGYFGILGFYYEDLEISEMEYNRKTKTLYLKLDNPWDY